MQIGIWGDSITYGSHDSEALGWVGRLRKHLVKKDSWVGVYNFGISGDTTSDLLKRFQVEAMAIQPSCVVFAIGINDSKQDIQKKNLISLMDYENNLQKLVGEAKQFCKNILIIGATRVDESLCNEGLYSFINSEIEKYNAVMHRVAGEHQLVFVDMFTVLEDSDLDDGLHPNAQGYQKMFEIIREKVKAT